MKRGGIVRSVDELGRITIPKELRQSLGWEPQTRVEFVADGEEVRLRRYGTGCAFCGRNLVRKEYLGIDVPDDKRGVLQDSHWSFGAIGYFPSYAIGSAYGAQFLAEMNKSFDVFGTVAKGDLTPVTDWLREHIWKYGKLYSPSELFRWTCGEFRPEVFIEYLNKKYREIYKL